MAELLEHLGKDTLPRQLVNEFVSWCVFEQGHPALLLVLDKTMMTEVASKLRDTTDLATLYELGQQANQLAKQARERTGPLGLSAAEAAANEFTKMIDATSETNWDAEGVAFFASRVCGWAGWAETDFADPMQKAVAEKQAREAQEARLEELWRQVSGT